jgi:hypothetical protein
MTGKISKESKIKSTKYKFVKYSWTPVAHSVILPTWEAEIRRITVGGQPEQTV